MICPCQNQQDNAKLYKECCEPFHLGKIPANPEALMRSRFSGYALGLNEYISNSWHPSTRPDNLNIEEDDQWVKLEIVSSNKKQVHFCAYFKNEHFNNDLKNGFSVLEETSNFVFESGKWFYLSGNSEMSQVKQLCNHNCLCGSGKKFKKCCGL